MKKIYMDHSATTPVTKAAFDAMVPYFMEEFGNPSAVYDYGQTGKNAVEKCRNRVAKALGALPTEIYFTSGGTESDNWVIRSVARSKKDKGMHLISCQTEHNAVRKTLEQLEEDGYEVTWLVPDQYGRITPEQLEEAIRPDTILISLMLANNVVGTIQDIKSLAAVARKQRVLFHTDAVQAIGHIPVSARSLGVDFLSVSAHKFGGPKGVGVLFCKLPNRLKPFMTGGGQEKEGRSGTENVPGIVGMTVALEESVANLDASMAYLKEQQKRMIDEVTSLPNVTLTGDPENRLPGFCSFVVDGVSHSVLLVNELNARGVSVSSGSACSASSKEASHVLVAMGYDKQLASASLRVTMGMDNTQEDVTYAIAQMKETILKICAEQVTRAPRLEGRVSEIKS